jgi:hypothetical protein
MNGLIKAKRGGILFSYPTDVAPRFFRFTIQAYGKFQAEAGGTAQRAEGRALCKEQTNGCTPVEENPYGLGQGRREGGETQATQPSMTGKSIRATGWQYETAAFRDQTAG